MKGLFTVFFICFALLASVGHGAITCSRYTQFKSSQAIGDFTILESGRFEAIDSRLLGLSVEGKAEIVRSCVQGECTTSGMVKAEETQFEKKVSISSGRLILDRCVLPSLYIQDAGDTLITVELKGDTIIDGSIYFETGTGCVFAGPDVVIRGEVVGGELNRG